MSYVVAVIAVIVGARYWFLSMDLREENDGLKKVNDILRNENIKYAEKVNGQEHSISLLTRQLVKYMPKQGKDGRFVRKKK